MNLKSKIWLISVLIGFFLITSCSNKKRENSIDEEKSGGILNISLFTPVETFDPNKILYNSDWQASMQIYEGLVGYNDSYKSLEPLVAERWEVKENGKVYIFRIRDNIYFHDSPCFPNLTGRKVTANDILYTFKRIADPEKPSVNFSLFRDKIVGIKDFQNGKTNSIEGIKIIDSLSIEFRLTKPYVTFLNVLATSSAYIIPHEAVDFFKEDFYKHPVGTGPFKISYWLPTEELFLIKSNKYWGRDKRGNQLPYIDGISYKFLSDNSLDITEFLSGKLDFITIHELKYQKIKKRLADKKINIIKTNQGLNIKFFAFSMDRKNQLAKNPQLRKAIVMAFDRTKIVNSGSGYNLINSLVPEQLLGFKIREQVYDPVRAKEIISNFSEVVNSERYLIYSSVKSKDAEVLTKGMKDIGFKVKLDVHAKKYYKSIITDRPDIFRVSMIPAYPDPTEYYALFYSKSGKNNNLAQYSNPKYDELFEASLYEQDKEKRKNLFKQLEQILLNDVPVIYSTHSQASYVLLADKIKNFKFRYMFPDFRYIWVTHEKK